MILVGLVTGFVVYVVIPKAWGWLDCDRTEYERAEMRRIIRANCRNQPCGFER